MAPQQTPRRKLLVEGEDDKRIIPELMEANGVQWEDSFKNHLVEIKASGGFSEILKPGVIEAESKSPGLESLGIILDADGDPVHRWKQVRKRCLHLYPDLPDVLPESGTVSGSTSPRFGVWMMPDNVTEGMMETFLLYLTPDQTDSLYSHAVDACDIAQTRGAPFKDAHRDKALIHTWLAWQDPPGQQLYRAVLQRILSPTAEYAQNFIRWFRDLYEV